MRLFNMRLYRVRVETDILVVADSEKAATKIAKENAANEIVGYSKATANLISKKEEIPDIWKQCVPYSESSIEKRICMDVMDDYGEVVENKPTENKPIENKPTENKPIDKPKVNSPINKLPQPLTNKPNKLGIQRSENLRF